MRPFRVRAAIVLAAVASLTLPAAAETPAAIEKVVQRFAADSAGVIGVHETVVFDQRAPGNNEHDEREYTLIQQDRITVAVHLIRLVRAGHTLNADELAQAQAEQDKAIANGPARINTRFAMPYYTFSPAKACTDCAVPAQVVEFKSAAKDERHLKGTLTYDPATSRPLKLECLPNALPKGVTSAKVTYTYARHDDGGWGVARIEEHYSGQMMMIRGTGDRTTTFVHGRRFSSVDEAKRAVQSGML